MSELVQEIHDNLAESLGSLIMSALDIMLLLHAINFAI